VLDAAAEATGSMSLLMIDALNESVRSERWQDDARALMVAAARYGHVGLVLSCRTEFVDTVLGHLQVPTTEHVGFAEATDTAVRRFTQDYGLEAPTFPVLNPEFSNPLYLKLTCEALVTLGSARFPFGAAGLITVCNAFLEAVNKRLCQPGRSDYDEATDPVRRVVKEIAQLGPAPFKREEVQKITEAALPGRPWSQSLMSGLIGEGVLVEFGDRQIGFGYQRLGDVVRAGIIADTGPDDVRNWLNTIAPSRWRERGVLGALAVILPERYGMELLELAADDRGLVSYDQVDSFLESLLLRSPEAVTPRAQEIVKVLLEDENRVGEVWDHLVRIACVPGHALNAEWLHAHLSGYDIADRDVLWSSWLVDSLDRDEESSVRRLIDWAWPINLDERDVVPDDVAALATLLFGWLLTTSDRRVRDRATKAIVSVGERAPEGFARTLGIFRVTNDPYIVERLAAAACGVALRTSSADVIREIADAILELVADTWPLHLLTRDFGRRVLKVAGAEGWQGPEGRPPYDAQWPIETRSIEEIERLAGPPEYRYGSIWHSLAEMGDFGRYVVQSALRNVVTDDRTRLQHEAERAIFDRVLHLGWTPERFKQIDGTRRNGRDGPVERVGKKYQWIGLYEVLGRIADNHLVGASWGNEEPRPYEYAEQLVWRDIDPSVLVRKPRPPSAGNRSWFSPVDARFQRAASDEYPADLAGVPDPLDIVAVEDADGAAWLALVSNPTWDQPLPPEVLALKVPRREVWMQVHAYLVSAADIAALRAWATDKDWYGAWMPDVPEAHNVLLGTHPEDPLWSLADGSVDWWGTRTNEPPPTELWQPSAWYGGTGTSRDASADDETRGYVPTRRLFDLLGLRKGADFAWHDAAGVAVRDPSVLTGGPATLVMRRDLVSRLTEQGLTIFWTVLIGNELRSGDYGRPDDAYRWVNASASYVVTGRGVELIGAVAAQYEPGPSIVRSISWMPRQSEGQW
jgi:hypothetical protein